jgi:acetate kinase
MRWVYAMTDVVLVVNAGSSSLKFQVYAVERGATLTRRLKGQVDGIGSHPQFVVRDAAGGELVRENYPADAVPDPAAAIAKAGAWLQAHAGALPIAVGHRIVHGGPRYAAPMLVDDRLIAELDRLVPLAPLHQLANLAPIRALRAQYPQLVQVACFDTAFHRGHSELADRFAVPEELYAEGVRRYGFHGLSYEYIAACLPDVAPEIARGRVVVAHLGSGASMCALRDGRSVDTTMGFSALDGLPMGTRPGQLDPGVILYLLAKGMSRQKVERMLYRDCGLKGLSGISNDVRELLSSTQPRAHLALDYFMFRAARELGALAASLGGLDGIVFTAGIGENAPSIREGICQRSAWLGIALDADANANGGPRISTSDSWVGVYVFPTDEERMIAEHTLAVLRGHSINPIMLRGA